MLKKNPKIFSGALYRIATATFLGIWTLNVTNLSRNEDTKCHKRYHAGKKPIMAANSNYYHPSCLFLVHILNVQVY